MICWSFSYRYFPHLHDCRIWKCILSYLLFFLILMILRRIIKKLLVERTNPKGLLIQFIIWRDQLLLSLQVSIRSVDRVISCRNNRHFWCLPNGFLVLETGCFCKKYLGFGKTEFISASINRIGRNQVIYVSGFILVRNR